MIKPESRRHSLQQSELINSNPQQQLQPARPDQPPQPPSSSSNKLALFPNDLNLKKQLLKKFYQVTDSVARKNLLLEWPSPKNAIHDIVAAYGYIEMKNNSFLVGNVSNNLIHGYGLVLYSNIRFYQGYFQNNFKHGSGLQYLPDGIYIGNYINNKPEGRGCFYWNNGESYEGEFVAGMKHGSGRWASSSENYTGQWKSNKPQGMGVIITSESRYQGEVRAGLKHGQGKQEFKNGDKYTGNYVNGKPEGQGEYIWNKNSSYFRGTFKNGLRHGHGVWVQGGDRYEGNYMNDKKNGKGTFKWASGNHYVGCYFDDLRHGYGEMFWSDGSWYKGQWKYGIQHGVGEMCESGQQPRRGIFQNNVLMRQQDVTKKLKIDKFYRRPFMKPRDQPNNRESRYQTNNKGSQNMLDDYGEHELFHRKVPSFVTRPARFNGYATKSTLNADSEKKSQVSNDSKEQKSMDGRSNKGISRIRMYTQQKQKPSKSHSLRPVLNSSHSPVADMSIIQWSNVKNIHTAPLHKSRANP